MISQHIPHFFEAQPPLRNRLPELLSQLLDSTHPSSPSLAIATANLQDIPQTYLEVLNFLMARPTPSDIVAFKVSPTAQERLRSLLDKNREGTLTESEAAELDVYEQLEHLMILMKARAMNTGVSKAPLWRINVTAIISADLR